MPVLRFESADALRIALAAGALPNAATPVRASRDRLTIACDTLPNVDALRRLGGKFIADTATAWREWPHWYALVPLERSDFPNHALKRLVAGPAWNCGEWLMPLSRSGTIRDTALHGDRLFARGEFPIVPESLDIYHETSPGHWVRAGFHHRLNELLPAGPRIIYDPDDVFEWPSESAWRATVDLQFTPTAIDQATCTPIPVRLKLPAVALASSPLVRVDDEAAFAAWLATLPLRRREKIKIAWLNSNGLIAQSRSPIPLGTPLATPDVLQPPIRVSFLHQQLNVAESTVLWMDESAKIHHVEASTFQPAGLDFTLATTVDYTDARIPVFAFEPFATVSPVAEESAELIVDTQESTRETWLDKLFRPLKTKRTKTPTVNAEIRTESAERPRRDFPTRDFDDRELLDFEKKLLNDYAQLLPRQRCHAWAELAEVNRLRRAYAEASRCWLAAIWEHPNPPRSWFDAWRAVERDPARQAAISVIASPTPSTVLPQHDWPIRLIWLSALAKQDLLHLARTRDSLHALIADGLRDDRDAPAFLRRQADEETLAVRDWLKRNRTTARKWIERLTRGYGRLQHVGLDADPRTTMAYADLLFARAAEHWGESVIARGWRHEAEATLHRELDELRPVHERLISRLRAEHPSNEKSVTELPPLAAFAVVQFECVLSDDVSPWATQDPVDNPWARLNRCRESNQIQAAEKIAKDASAALALSADARIALAAAAWLVAGHEERGFEWLNACRDQLYSPHRLSPRDQTRLATATARSLAFASPRIARGRLEEMFHRLEGIDLTGSTNRYFTRQPLTLIRAALTSAGRPRPTPDRTVVNWLAEDERIIRQRIARDSKDIGL